MKYVIIICAMVGVIGFGQEVAEFEGHFYQIVTEQTTWKEAYTASRQSNGHLAIVDNAKEAAFITRLIYNTRGGTGRDGACRIGGFNLAPADKGSAWKWVNNAPVRYNNWHIGEPQKDGDTIAMCSSGVAKGKWRATPRATTMGYVCEWNKKPALTQTRTEKLEAYKRSRKAQSAAIPKQNAAAGLPQPSMMQIPNDGQLTSLLRILPPSLHPDTIRRLDDRLAQDRERKVLDAFYRKYARGQVIKLNKLELVSNMATQRFKQTDLTRKHFITSRINNVKYKFQPIDENGIPFASAKIMTAQEFFKAYTHYDYIEGRILSASSPFNHLEYQLKVELDLQKVRPSTAYYRYNFWGYKVIRK